MRLNTNICMECCLNVFEHTHIWKEYGLNVFEYTHIAWNIDSFEVIGLFSFSSILLSHCEEVLVKSLAQVNTISVSSVTLALASLFHDASDRKNEWMDE